MSLVRMGLSARLRAWVNELTGDSDATKESTKFTFPGVRGNSSNRRRDLRRLRLGADVAA